MRDTEHLGDVERTPDPIKELEEKRLETEREMAVLDALEKIQVNNARREARASHGRTLVHRPSQAEEQDQADAEEYRRARERFRRSKGEEVLSD